MVLFIENEKGRIEDVDHRRRITKVRGGWTEEKIKKELKTKKNSTGEVSFFREIAKFDTPEEFADNFFYHGSGRSIGMLKPSIILKDTFLGGGYDDKYYGISLSKDRNIASNFTGDSAYGCVAPVILRRGAVIKKMPEVKDSNEINEMIVDLWTEGVDAVVIGDHSKPHSEQEVVILNPCCIAIGKSNSFKVFNKTKMPSLTKEELTDLWISSSDKYKETCLKSWDLHNEAFKLKFGKEKSIETRWHSKNENVFNFHKANLEIYNNKLKEVSKLKTKTKLK